MQYNLVQSSQWGDPEPHKTDPNLRSLYLPDCILARKFLRTETAQETLQKFESDVCNYIIATKNE
jgi:hypothetical protein